MIWPVNFHQDLSPVFRSGNRRGWSTPTPAPSVARAGVAPAASRGLIPGVLLPHPLAVWEGAWPADVTRSYNQAWRHGRLGRASGCPRPSRALVAGARFELATSGL